MKPSESLVPVSPEQRALPATRDAGGARLGRSLVPKMWAHLVLTGDRKAHRKWKRRLDAIMQAEAVDAATDDETRIAVADPSVWRKMRRADKLGGAVGLALAAGWMSWLIPAYVAPFGAAALAYLLPLPFAWRVGRKRWQRAALKGELDTRAEEREGKPRSRFMKWVRGAGRSFSAGFGFGFSLVFLQGLVSWFMTPAPTIGLELAIDFVVGVQGGLLTGTAATLLAPLVSGRQPDESRFPALGDGGYDDPLLLNAAPDEG